ncbi:TetR/AcrR family transcriptional regulator [Marinobacter salinisoli]|uniref:TetR/AcrR family transcriptional regulator n=1 Tax=Marinobacter salinisoli TaxID=2769486 RepID=A0ABX7MTG6_9GAMM|nr:TetR/AcrR family transcriptional regulator [Marinobacter salinisoli]QSP95667.1 TetR/AcrR family transcriptional regulator [Marinobacter salinisoli]
MARHARYDRPTLLNKAITLFWDRGYHGSSMKQIEQALDLRPGSIYAAFGSKDGLFAEALAAYAEQGRGELMSYLEHRDSVVEGLQAYLRALAGSRTSDKPARACMIIKTLLESSNTHPQLADQAETILADIRQALVEALEQAKGAGELIQSTDCDRLARLIQTQIVGLRSMAERGLTPRELAELADDIASLLDSYRAAH